MLGMLRLLVLSIIVKSVTAAGVWSAWQPISLCSTTCGGGTQTFDRTCFGGNGQCLGSVTESRPCNINPCPLGLSQGSLFPWNANAARPCTPLVCIPQWSLWSPWTVCSATCFGGQRRRRRFCPGNPRCPGPQEVVEPCGVAVCSNPLTPFTNPGTNSLFGPTVNNQFGSGFNNQFGSGFNNQFGSGANSLLGPGTQFMAGLLQNPTSLFQAMGLPSTGGGLGGRLPSFNSLLAAFPTLLQSFPTPLQSQFASLHPGVQQSLFANILSGAFNQLGLAGAGTNTAFG